MCGVILVPEIFEIFVFHRRKLEHFCFGVNCCCNYYIPYYIFPCMLHVKTQNMLLTVANQPSCFCFLAQISIVNLLRTLPQVCAILITYKIPECFIFMLEGGVKGYEMFDHSTIQHITGHCSFFLLPARVTHCPPSTIAMDFHSPSASIQTSCQSQSLVFFIKIRGDM